MECASVFPAPASPKQFVRDLDDLGYETGFVGAHFALYGLPYLDQAGALQHGDLYSPVNLGADGVIEGSDTHQCWWVGSRPYGRDGVELGVGFAENPRLIVEGLTANTSFSLKLRDGDAPPRDYASFEEKIRTYLDVIVEPAKAAYPDASPLRGIERRVKEQGSPLLWPDTMSANYGVNDIADKLRGKRVAIVGAGGTGSCILDFIVRTHLESITLFDGDKVHVHTLFRIPGFLGKKVIGKPKVEVLAQHYGGWHSGITPVPEKVTVENVERLRGLDFVFVSVDDGPARRFIVEWLSREGVAFVDCGMGLNRSFGGMLNGMVRITGTDRAAYERTVDTPYLPTDNPVDAEYRKQAQVIELNAMNACLAVVRFKQHFGLYERADEAACRIFETASLETATEKREP